jgi:hypothetical protein
MAKQLEDLNDDTGETVQLEDATEDDVEDTEDGGAIIRLANEKDTSSNKAHFANIIDEVDADLLEDSVTDLLEKIERDKEAREKRDKQYEEGLRRTGLGDDAPGGAQFSGANKVVHPMLVESCVDFSARFMKEIFPPNGPVKTKVLGEQDDDKLDKAQRKADFMNWQTTEQMPEFRSELEQLSTQLPLGGGQYMKVMWNHQHRRPTTEFISIDDVYLPFAATNFYAAERKTHVQYITKFEYGRRVKSGMYIDVDLGSPNDPEFSKSSIANDKIEGRKETSYNEDGLRTVFEVYTYLDFGDGAEPYILTIDKSSGLGLSLYRNWELNDELKNELDWIVEFAFIPWRGAYPIGLTHMIGGLSGAATGALRALLDSAHIQNIPTMLKLKGGPGGQTLNLQPTEIAEIDGGAMIDDIRKIAMPIPFNGPSPVLFQLLGFLVDAGKGVVQTSFENLSSQNPNQPVGTTMALIEQGMVVFSSIHSRLHSSMSKVLGILHRINSAYLTIEDIEAQKSGLEIDPSDFDGPLDIIPVSDPAIFSETQRFAQVQALMQRAAVAPQMYDARKIEEMFLRAMKIPDKDVLNPLPNTVDMDPVSENVAATMGQPVYVLPKQDHIAHMMLHLAFLKSPLFGQNPVIMKTYLYPMATHLRDHLLNYYLVESHEAISKGHKEKVIKANPDEETKLILEVQQLIEQQLSTFAQELAQIDESAQQFKPQPPMPPDNSMQIAQMNAQLQGQALQQTNQLGQAKLNQEAQLKQAQLAQDAQFKQAQITSDIKKQQDTMAIEQMRQAGDDQRTMAELESRERMNAGDNQTAMHLAQAEIMSGENIAVSTGTGINPGS